MVNAGIWCVWWRLVAILTACSWSSDDDAVRELAACCLPGSGRHHSPRNQAIEFARPRFKLLPAPESSPCTSLKTTSPSASRPACFFACLPIAIASYSSSILQSQHHQPPHNLKMKTSIALLAVGASFAVAQSISDLPPCGVSLYSLLYALFAQP